MTNQTQSEESKRTAKKAGLLYVSDKSPGFLRLGKPKKFRYNDSKGKLLHDARHLARIKSLVIPPAWQNVWICTSPRGHIQCTGIDARGRKQYRYHADWNQVRNEKKFSKMNLFASKLPEIRKKIKLDLKNEGMGREKMLAAIVKIMEATLIRVGNEEYTKANRSYGLTTIRNRHVKVRGTKIIFDFKGKSGRQSHVEMSDPYLSKIVKKCQELPGQELFAYRDQSGRVQKIHSQHVNQYLHEISGENISAKDFRTWGGTVCAALFLRDLETPKTKKDLKEVFKKMVDHTSSTLRNTPAVCKKYYIHPHVFESFQNGEMAKIGLSRQKSRRSRGLYPAESFTKALINAVRS